LAQAFACKSAPHILSPRSQPPVAAADMANFGESIYNMIPPKMEVREKPPMHRSKYAGTQPPTGSTFHAASTTCPAYSNTDGAAVEKPVADKTHGTFGKKQGGYSSDPNGYMKKAEKTGGRVLSLAEVKTQNPEALAPKHLKTRTSIIPKADEAPVMNLVTSKNFIVANAVETILSAPRKLPEGAKDFLKKEDYGKVPKYLQHIKQDIEAEYDYIQQLHQDREEEEYAQKRPLGEDERGSIVEGLKSKWEQVNTAYQGGTHMTKMDTMGKMKRKERYEAELSQIEKDIEKMSRGNIVVDSRM